MKKIILKIRDLVNAHECVFFDASHICLVNDASYFFVKPVKVITASCMKEVVPALKQIDNVAGRYWLAGYIRYEAAAAFFAVKGPGFEKMHQPSSRPLLWFGVYDQPAMVEAFDTSGAYAPLRCLKPALTYQAYRNIFYRIKNELQAGNTYQVNFTLDFLFQGGASPEFLYAYLREYQRTPYCAFIRNDEECVLSFSPELFFHRDGRRIWTSPMKGTMARGIDEEDDVIKRETLCHDEKNCAENLMIVDLLRNDLGKIADVGTVRVPSLFNVETHETLHQMTSLIEADLKSGIDYADIFNAVFPCGSVTGAPKIKTMELIDQLEQGVRGVYCGAIGYIAPCRKAVFSVPIRILQKAHDDQHWQYRAGSGIVWDSTPQDEWKETQVKASFLMAGMVNDVCLVETMSWADGHFTYEKYHMHRMRRSARDLEFHFDTQRFAEIMGQIANEIKEENHLIVRLLLNRSGCFSFECRRPDDFKPLERPVVKIAAGFLDSQNEWLRHKTTYRPWYDDAIEKITRGEVWDVLFFNERDELCEGARSNIFVKKGGCLYTPPVICGLLPGVFRDRLLKAKKCEEKILREHDLFSADEVYCGNSVRGLVKVKVTRGK